MNNRRLLPAFFLTALCSLPVQAADMDDAMRAARLRDYGQMAAILQPLAASGNKDAQYQLARLYRNGLGVEKDLDKALLWSDKAARQGVQEAAQLYATLCPKSDRCQSPDKATIDAAAATGEQLRAAVRRNESANVQALLALGVAADSPDRYGRTPLLAAVENGNQDIIQQLLHAHANVNRADQYGESPLRLAIVKDDEATARILLQAGASVNSRDAQGNTPLLTAVSQSSTTLVALLLSFHADVNLAGQDGLTPLQLAQRKNHQPLIARLQQAGAVVPASQQATPLVAVSADESKLFQGWPPLMIAAWLNQPQRLQAALQTLPQSGAGVDDTDSEGHSALTRAAWRGNTGIVEQLLRAGADIEHQDVSGRTALLWSLVGQEKAAVTRLLLRQQVNLNHQDAQGKTALLLAIENHHTDLVKDLLAAGANPNLADSEGTVALITATRLQQQDTIALLLQYKAATGIADRNGRSAVWFAADEGADGILRLLLAAHASTTDADHYGQRSLERAIVRHCQSCLQQLAAATTRDELLHSTKDGNTLLSLAAELGNAQAVSYLIGQQLPLDTRNRNGNSALMLAAAKGHTAIVETLLQAGADPLLRNQQKKNARDLAAAAGHDDTVQTLDAHGVGKDGLWKIITG